MRKIFKYFFRLDKFKLNIIRSFHLKVLTLSINKILTEHPFVFVFNLLIVYKNFQKYEIKKIVKIILYINK